MLKMIFASFRNHQEGDPLQEGRGMPAVSSPVGMESTPAAAPCWIRPLHMPDLPQQSVLGMTASQKHLLSSAFKVCQRVVSSCCCLPSMRHSKYKGLITLY